MDFTLSEIPQILPLIVVAGAMLVTMVIEMYVKRSEDILGWFSTAALLFTAYYSLLTVNDTSSHFGGMLASGGTANIFYFIFTFGGAIVCLLSLDYIKKAGIYFGEFYILLLSAVLGMMLIASARDLVMIFVGLEQMSITFYILAGMARKRGKALEASLKYFLLGAFATGFIVYGMALLYGSVQSLSLEAVIGGFSIDKANIIYIAGLLLFTIGFSFKIAAFPFHMWVPDVYQGSPTTVTALMSTGGKAAAFAALTAALVPAAGGAAEFLRPFLITLSVLSMLYGSIVAIAQSDIKRMLAYSSIAHAGYMLIGIAAANVAGVSGIIYYLGAYTFMNLGAFGIISIVENEDEGNLEIDKYSGLGSKNPLLAALLAVFMFALSGIPPFAGFFGKYYVFIAALKADLIWLAILGVVSSVISVYFYLHVIVVMYFKKSDEPILIKQSSTALLGVVIAFLLVIVMGIAPNSIITLIESFIR